LSPFFSAFCAIYIFTITATYVTALYSTKKETHKSTIQASFLSTFPSTNKYSFDKSFKPTIMLSKSYPIMFSYQTTNGGTI
jgi:hypothetical protein